MDDITWHNFHRNWQLGHLETSADSQLHALKLCHYQTTIAKQFSIFPHFHLGHYIPSMLFQLSNVQCIKVQEIPSVFLVKISKKYKTNSAEILHNSNLSKIYIRTILNVTLIRMEAKGLKTWIKRGSKVINKDTNNCCNLIQCHQLHQLIK